jgi:hypothetical protein
MAEPVEELVKRLDDLERFLKRHLGPQAGATTLQRPHTGIPYLDSDGKIKKEDLPETVSATPPGYYF